MMSNVTTNPSKHLIEKSIEQRSPFTAGHLLRNKKGPAGLVSIGPGQRVSEAFVLMEFQEFSELPVVEGGRVVGNLSDVTLAREVHFGTNLGEKTVRDIMESPLLQVDVNVDIQEVYQLLRREQPGLIVTQGNKAVGFLNRLDLVDYWKRQTFWDKGGI